VRAKKIIFLPYFFAHLIVFLIFTPTRRLK